MLFFKFDFIACLLVAGVCLVVVSPTQSNKVSKGISNFASEFYQECVKTKSGNVILSPFSVANSLALLSQATSGSSFEELRNGLHLTGDKETIANEFHEFNKQLRQSIGETTLIVANKVYVKHDKQLKNEFQEVAISKFASDVESVDFENADESAAIINRYVAEKTNDEISNFIKPSIIGPDTVVFLINAVYFKGTWEISFKKDATREKPFYITESESIPADFMYKLAKFKYASHFEYLDASAIEMNYAMSNISFVIVLPHSRTGLPELEAKLKEYDLTNITSQLHSTFISAVIPKFKVDYEIELNDVLKNMGMAKIFETEANLDGLLASGDSLEVSKVIHKAFIEINEDGSEAAAGSGVEVMRRITPPRFAADHPFMYFIRDTVNDIILFGGRIEKVGKI